MENQIQILHLTDIHISSMEKPEVTRKKWEMLIEQVKSLSPMLLDLVAVTGDISSHGQAREYRLAISYLNWLAKACQIPKDRFVFCPGNHDADKPCTNSSFLNYEKFLVDFFEPPLGTHIQKNSAFDLWHCEKTVRIWQVNTNQTTSFVFYDNASIPVQDAEEILQNITEEEYNILLMHHQPSCISNEDLFKKVCEKMDLVLCGHLHPNRPIISVCQKAIIVNGMALTPHLVTIQKGCQLVTVVDDNVSVKPLFINISSEKGMDKLLKRRSI